MAKYCVIACDVLRQELEHFAKTSGNEIDLVFLEQGLHVTPDRLREEVQKAVDQVKGDYSAILLGYGLCSNGLEGIEARDTKLVVARAHDCITFLLGSKERYREYFDAHPGTYWYSPGWIETGTQPGKERHDSLYKEYVEKYGEDNAEYLMETEQGWFKEYTNAAYTDLGFGDMKRYRDYSQSCAKWLGWNYEEVPGDAKLIKAMLEDEWDEDTFIVVEPGHKIVASHDDNILKAEKRVDRG